MTKENDISKVLSELRQLLKTQPEEPPLNFDEACSYLKCSKAYLYKLTCKKMISYFKPNGKFIYFLKSDLNAFLTKGRRETLEETETKAKNFLSTSKR